ncbi:MAG: hypothetical protein H6698_02280 [Myxococcales bacterium]|nr:hypothetical protein [Myxococcales bacterium]MCB9519953.1 hypothetical protein [Myxococcales bacterium]MCB9533139.1 hypothetical protein [Myxococcales bacterium]
MSKPQVVVWYDRYCRVAVALAALAGAAGLFLAAQPDWVASSLGVAPLAARVLSALWAGVMAFLGLVHVAALMTPPSPWAWKIHAVVLGVGLTTILLWPAALPLLFYWFREDTRAYFHSPQRAAAG